MMHSVTNSFAQNVRCIVHLNVGRDFARMTKELRNVFSICGDVDVSAGTAHTSFEYLSVMTTKYWF